jgi:hypothetical protein
MTSERTCFVYSMAQSAQESTSSVARDANPQARAIAIALIRRPFLFAAEWRIG